MLLNDPNVFGAATFIKMAVIRELGLNQRPIGSSVLPIKPQDCVGARSTLWKLPYDDYRPGSCWSTSQKTLSQCRSSSCLVDQSTYTHMTTRGTYLLLDEPKKFRAAPSVKLSLGSALKPNQRLTDSSVSLIKPVDCVCALTPVWKLPYDDQRPFSCWSTSQKTASERFS